MRIPYTKPSITELEVSLVTDAAATGWGEKCYEYISRFETEFAAYIQTDFALATSSCTGALHLGLAALDIGEGDEVILADTNWIATVAPIVHLGATPIFVDIEPKYWCIDPREVRKAISPRTKAIIATHLYGNVADLDELAQISEEFGIPVIEDSAEAIGARHRGRPTGSIGLFGVFSFHGTKTMTTGEGGMFVTNDPNLYDRVLTLSNHGRSRSQSKQFWPDFVGYKFKMSNIQAALGCAQLSRIEELVARKAEIMRDYRSRLGDFVELQLNEERTACQNAWWMPTVVWSNDRGIHRDSLQREFIKRGVDARVFFPPLSSLPMFDTMGGSMSREISTRALNLPSFHSISEPEIAYICKTVEDGLGLSRSS